MTFGCHGRRMSVSRGAQGDEPHRTAAFVLAQLFDVGQRGQFS
jgi:hypothetical protein